MVDKETVSSDRSTRVLDKTQRLHHPGMNAVPVTKDVTYKTTADGPLALDLYHPVDQPADQPASALVFIHGEAPPAELKTAKDWGQYFSWGQLAAASGIVGVTFTHRLSQ